MPVQSASRTLVRFLLLCSGLAVGSAFCGDRQVLVFVIGQANKPGMFVMNPQLTVLQALALAGGTTPFAKLDGILIVRGSGASQTAIPFRYSRVSEGKSLGQNIMLESGDVVVVP